MFTNNTWRYTRSTQILAQGGNSRFLWLGQNFSQTKPQGLGFHRKQKVYLLFLQNDFLLQHFDGVELVVRLVLSEQDLHEGLFVSGLFGKHGVAPLSLPLETLDPEKKKKLSGNSRQHRSVSCGNR